MITGLDLNRNVRPVNRWKAAFPSLQAEDGKALHYLDNAATTQKPVAVIEAVQRCYTEGEGPIHRGLYPLAETASLAYEQARRQVARFIGAVPVSATMQPSASLSARELEVLALVAQGLSNEAIGEQLALSTRTVERHLSNLYGKLGLSGRSARAAAAARFHDLSTPT